MCSKQEACENTKFLVHKNKKYKVCFDNLKKKSQYFYRYQEQFKQITDINLLNEFDDGLVDISEEAIKTLIDSCQKEKFQISISDIISLQYLSYKFEFTNIIYPIENIILKYSNDLYIQSYENNYILLSPNSIKTKLTSIKLSKSQIINQLFRNNHLFDKIRSFSISIFDRIMNKYNKILNQNMANIFERIELLIEYLQNFRTSSSVLFSFVSFLIQLIDLLNKLILDQSNILHSTSKVLNLTNSLTKIQEYFIKMKNELQKIINRIDENLNKVKKYIKYPIKNDKIQRVDVKIKKESQELFWIKYNQIENIPKYSIVLVIKINNKIIFNIKAESTDLIEEIKRKIEQKEKIPIYRQCLLYKTEKLQDNETIHHYSINDFSIIDVIIYPKSVNVFVNFLKRKSIFLNLQRNNLIKDVKAQIEKIEGIPTNQQQLLYCGQKLEDEKIIQNYRIQDYSIIQVLNNNDQFFLISIISIGFNTSRILVKSTDLISDIKAEIEKSMHIKAKKQKLMFHGIQLENNKSIQYYSINQNSELFLLNKLTLNKIKISKSEKEYCYVNVNQYDTYGDVKRKIELNECIPSNQLHLFLNHTELENDKKVSFYSGIPLLKISIVYENNIHLCIRTCKGTIIVIDALQTYTIQQIKEKINQIEHIESEKQCLIFNGIELENDKKVQDYFIPNYSVIQLTKYDAFIKINVCSFIGKIYHFIMKPFNFIKDIKAKIERIEKIPIINQFLEFDKKKLDDKKRILDYPIENDSKIDLFISLGSMNLHIRRFKMKTLQIKVNQTDSIKSVKQSIERIIAIPNNQLVLMYEGKKLKNDKTLYDYSIHFFSEIELFYPKSLQIKVSLSKNKTITINVKKYDLICDIKEKICKIERIPIDQQFLFLNGQKLEDDKKVQEYQIENNSKLEIKIRPLIKKIIIQLNDDKIYKFNMIQINLISDIKDKIKNIINVPLYKQNLKFDGINLENEKTIQYYSIENGSKLNLEICNDIIMIYAKTPNYKSIQLYAQKKDLIRDIKRKIEWESKIPINKQFLIFSGKELDDLKTIQYYSINDLSILFLLIRFEIIKLNIQIIKGKLIQIEVKNTDLIKDIKEMIESREKIPSYQQNLIFNEKNLDDKKDLQFYSIQNGSIINLSICLDAIQLILLTNDKDECEIIVQKSQRIEDIKNIISKMVKIPPYQLLISYEDKELENEKTIHEYSIQHRSKLKLVVCLYMKKLYISLPSGEKIHFIVSDNDDIINIKKTIEKMKGIPWLKQILLFKNNEISNINKIKNYPIKDESTIYCKINPDILYPSIKTANGNSYHIVVNKKDSIKDIKTKICMMSKMPLYRLQLIFKGKELEDDKIVQKYSIEYDSTINLNVRLNLFCLYVRTLNGKTIRFILDHNDSNTIISIKNKVEQVLDIPVYRQRLIYNGKCLEDYKTIENYSSEEESIKIHVVESFLMRIHISTNEGNKFHIFINENETILKIKTKIKKIENIPENEQRLVYKGKRLNDNKKIIKDTIENESTIHLLYNLGTVHLLIRTIEGKQFYIDVDLSELIESVKEMINMFERIPSKEQILIASGKVLENEKTIQDYSINDYQVLHVFYINRTIQIFVNLINDGNIVIRVCMTDKIIYIKEKIQEKKRILITKQNLYYEGKKLQDDSDIQSNGIRDNSTLFLV